jgi:lipopolysaccharide export system permease protein
MSRLTLYLNKMFLRRFVVVLIAATGFALLFDLLDVGSRVLRRTDGTTVALVQYAAIRLPSLLTEVLPLVTLVAALFTAMELIRRSELVVIWASGVSRAGVAARLLPMALLLMAGKFAIDDFGIPASIPELRALRVSEFSQASGPGSDGIWARSGDDIIRLPADAIASGRIDDVRIFNRDAKGLLIEQIFARHADVVPGGWELHDVQRRPASTAPPTELPKLFWPLSLPLDKVELMAKLPRELGIRDLADIVRHQGFGVGSIDAYQTWLHARIADLAMPALMMLLVFSLVRRFSRTGMVLPLFMQSLGIGFTAIITNGVLLALGEVGLVEPVLAAWTTPCLLALVVLLLSGAPELVLARLSGIGMRVRPA